MQLNDCERQPSLSPLSQCDGIPEVNDILDVIQRFIKSCRGPGRNGNVYTLNNIRTRLHGQYGLQPCELFLSFLSFSHFHFTRNHSSSPISLTSSPHPPSAVDCYETCWCRHERCSLQVGPDADILISSKRYYTFLILSFL